MHEDALTPADIGCPYCGQTIGILLDGSVGEQRYVEDCQVCCQPIEIAVWLDADGVPHASARTGDDA